MAWITICWEIMGFICSLRDCLWIFDAGLLLRMFVLYRVRARKSYGQRM